MNNTGITKSTENFLVAIYRLTRISANASTKELAGVLRISMPSVSEKIGKLAKKGYLDHRRRKGVILMHIPVKTATDSG